MLWNFALDGKGKWKVRDWLCRFYRSRTCDKREDLKRWSLVFGGRLFSKHNYGTNRFLSMCRLGVGVCKNVNKMNVH